MIGVQRREVAGRSTGTEQADVRRRRWPRTLALALVLGAGLFAAGFLAGRISTDPSPEDPASSTDVALADDAESAAVETGETTAEDTGDGLDPEAPGVQEGGSDDAGVATVSIEALEAELARIDVTAITFVPGTTEFNPDALATLDLLARILVAHPFLPVEVETSTFTESTAGENHGLSVYQAEAIVAYLVDNGVDRDRLAAVGLGSPLEEGFGQQTVLLFDSEDDALAIDLTRLDPLAFELAEDDTISPAGQTMLDQMSRILASHPAAPLRLVGYASGDSESARHDRSHLVVDQAVEYLAGLGVDVSRIEAVGVGGSTVGLDLHTDIELEVGFPAAATIAMNQVDVARMTFVTGTPNLTDAGLDAVRALAEAMAIDPESKVEISVHVYTEGDSEQNHDLSHLQGDAIEAALVEAGIGADRVVVLGHGDPSHFAKEGREVYVSLYPID